MEILLDYLIFLLKVITVALAVTIPLLMIIGSSKGKSLPKGKLSITNLSDKYEEMGNSVKGSIMHPKELKKFNKESAKKKKKKEKDEVDESIFVLNFKGDIQATEVEKLKQEINAILLADTECSKLL
ncbi:MAG: hypothetical protein CM15mP86_07530 [Gammaproteobacteria bacterium]|nr:MAG: hypothetical protein CM15mP86_07530 [Gammaproteobacteria bacterium]